MTIIKENHPIYGRFKQMTNEEQIIANHVLRYLIEITGDFRILDIGGRNGVISSIIQPNVSQITIIEPDPSVKRIPGVAYVSKRIQDYRIKDKMFSQCLLMSFHKALSLPLL